MKEGIAKNSLMVFATKLTAWFFLFLTAILIARMFGPKGIGTYDLFISVINFSVMIGSFGIGTASIYLLNKKKENAGQLFSNVLLLGIAWGVALSIISFVFFSRFFPFSFAFPRAYILMAVFAIPFVLLQNYLLPFFLAKFKIFQWSFFSILPSVFIFVGTFIALLVFHRALPSAAYAVFLSNILISFFLVVSVLHITPMRLRFSKTLFSRELAIGFASYVGDVFQAVNFRANLFFVSMFLNIAEVGYYSLALNIGNILFLVPYAFQQILYSAWSLQEEKEVDSTTPAMARQTLLVGVAAAFLLFFTGKYVVIDMLYGKNFLPSVVPLAFLLPGVVCMVFANTFFNNFFSKGKASRTALILLFTFAINIILNIFLIPRIGIRGAALSASFSYFVSAILALLLFSRASGFSVKTILTFQASDVKTLISHLWYFSGLRAFKRMLSGSRQAAPPQKIKICHVASADVSLRFLIFSHMRYLQKIGFEVYAVSSQGEWVKDIEYFGISHKAIRITRKVFTPIADLIALVRLYLFFRKERFAIVHTHTLKASFLGQIAAFFAGVPVRIYTIHGLDFLNTSFPPAARKIFMFVDRIIARLVHLTFAVNKEAIEIVQRIQMYPSNKIAYLGVGIDLERFNPARFSQDFIEKKKKEVGIPSGARVVGMVARLVAEKGFLELFEAFKKILKEYPNATLVIAGGQEPEKKDRITFNTARAFGIEKNVLFLGERRDINELNALFDVLVLPSYREGLGITLLEASAMEKPVVASDISGCREAVDKGKTGMLMPPKNPEKLAEAILYLFKNPAVAKAMGKAGRKKVEKEFDEKFVFERLRVAYERLLKENLKN